MKLISIYNKILLTELIDSQPYPYTIKEESWGWNITFVSKDNIEYTVHIDQKWLPEFDFHLKFNIDNINVNTIKELDINKKYYTIGCHVMEVTFRAHNSNYTAFTNKFDIKVLTTVALAVKKLVLDNDIQVVYFVGATKPLGYKNDEGPDNSNARSRIYVYMSRLLKPDNYHVIAREKYIYIYQDPDYYDKKRHIGKFANQTNISVTPNISSDNQEDTSPQANNTRRTNITNQTGPRARRTRRIPAPMYDDNGNLINTTNNITTISPTVPPEARRVSPGYVNRRPQFTYEIYRTKKQINSNNNNLTVIYSFKDETNFVNKIKISSSKYTDFPSLLNNAMRLGIDINTFTPKTTIAFVEISNRYSNDEIYIYRFLRTLITKIGEYIRLIKRTDKAIVVQLPSNNMTYGMTLMKDSNFIKLKNWYIPRTKYKQYYDSNLLIFYKQS